MSHIRPSGVQSTRRTATRDCSCDQPSLLLGSKGAPVELSISSTACPEHVSQMTAVPCRRTTCLIGLVSCQRDPSMGSGQREPQLAPCSVVASHTPTLTWLTWSTTPL